MKANNRICIGQFFRKGKAPNAPNALKALNAPKALNKKRTHISVSPR